MEFFYFLVLVLLPGALYYRLTENAIKEYKEAW